MLRTLCRQRVLKVSRHLIKALLDRRCRLCFGGGGLCAELGLLRLNSSSMTLLLNLGKSAVLRILRVRGRRLLRLLCL
jgi:hypothetical protein